MKKFSKTEIIFLVVIFLVLAAISVPDFITSIAKARDQARKDDLGSMFYILDNYFQDFGKFPMSTPDGRIIACKNSNEQVQIDKKGALLVNLIPCEWGIDPIVDLTPESNKIYVSPLPRDPNFPQKDVKYMYFSNGRTFQMYVHLESTDWDEYDPKIVARKIMCGSEICNAGRAYSVTPTSISIEEYEKQLKR